LTSGKPQVVRVAALDGHQEQVMRIAAALESRSEHPLAQAVVAAYQDGGRPGQALPGEDRLPDVTDFQAVPGKGAQGVVEGTLYRIGKPAWLTELGLYVPADELKLEEELSRGRTVMLLANEQAVLALFAVADVVRPESRKTLQRLKEAGIRRVVMLTGDHVRTAEAIANDVGVDEVHAELLPEQKLTQIRALQSRHGRVMMVGDGINDAPALASADIGVAMGGAGTDTALETADLVLMSDDLTKLPFAVRIGRQALGIIQQNIIFSLAVKAVFLALTVAGMSNLWMAVFADTGAALIVIANGMRLMFNRP
jgi:Cd2+/Zn2+-exporting ATPase